MTHTLVTDAGQDPPGRRPPRRAAVRHRAWLGAGALLVAAGALLLDAAVLTARIDRLPVQLHEGPGTTWVLVGEDSRADLPPGLTEAEVGTPGQVPGSRVDAVLVVHSADDRTTVLSVPRDLVVSTPTGGGRLALTWLDGPQATVDGLCALGIASDHLVSVDFAGFASTVDALGGLDVDVPAAVRDPLAGLELPRAGAQRVDGVTALAMVRSRHPEELRDGAWVAAPADPDVRARNAAAMVRALSGAAAEARWNPWRLQATAWAASGALSVDEGTSSVELASLASLDLDPVAVLPVGDPVNGTLARFPTEETTAALADAGLSCSG